MATRYSYGRRNNKRCKRECSGTDKVAAVLLGSVVLIVCTAMTIVLIAGYIVEQKNHKECDWIIDYTDTLEICGNVTLNKVSESKDCIDECMAFYNQELSIIYSINSTTSTSMTCYCLTMSQFEDINANNSNNKSYDYCFEVDENDSQTEIIKYIKQCGSNGAGRPYNINNNKYLVSDIKQIECNEYEYYEDNKWKLFITKHINNIQNNTKNNEILNKWLEQGVSEHASIATFSRFTLQLMSIGAPLWIIQLSNEACLEEIKHTKISFDVANLYFNGINGNNKCVIPNVFPKHNIDINGDWNEISKNTAIGGCFGETLAALTVNGYKYNNIIDDYLYEIAIEEMRHSALAWIVVKWMIDNSNDCNDSCIDIDVADKHWWNSQILNRKRTMTNVKTMYVYEYVIPTILEKMWSSDNYKELYQFILEKLQILGQAAECDNMCAFFLSEV